jgi:dTDP-4-amino-4,6-dideoxygalactose transaminase
MASERLSAPIRMQPVLGWGALRRPLPGTAPAPFPLDGARVALTFSGTAAVYQAVRALALPRGSVVLCPSYNCGHELEPILRLGLRVRCYRVDGNLETALEDLEREVDGDTRAILVTHYFGFGRDLTAMREFCDQRGLALIEDCAHAFLSDNEAGNLGRVGEVAAYSFRKTLPIPNGGAAVLNRPTLGMPTDLRPPPHASTWLKRLDLARKAALDRWTATHSLRDALAGVALAPAAVGGELIRRIRPLGRTHCYDPDDEDYGFAPDVVQWKMSGFSQRAVAAFDFAAIAAARRANYRRLAASLAGLRGCRPLRLQIADNCCPLFLPVQFDNRDEVYGYLLSLRINAALWWYEQHPAVDWSRFPEARHLKATVLALPIHQDITSGQVDFMADALRRCPTL